MSLFEKRIAELEEELPHLEPADLVDWRQAGRSFLLVDVRQPEEAAEGSIDGAVNIPRPKLEASIESHMQDPQQPVVVYCGYRGRSQLVADSLRAMGIDARVLRGGYSAWRDTQA
ncbi:rhodanese-like domain-containing protein [Thioalkalivibrio thiocyanoxidans]|uniref:rhodanese-like domain-containing protein n=1 Tax=Thioalkalivibrio thiocyanoxidans TaxID=152475 RepID=UPI0003662685|nr:rhodanese-like domain-containing protein [Thioalkalivibrio thiocyanoxidans]